MPHNEPALQGHPPQA